MAAQERAHSCCRLIQVMSHTPRALA
jgi:hypothetical protein